MSLDALAVAAHPDDAEIAIGGTLLRLVAAGKKVGIVDLTRGEMGTRGSATIRARESEAAARILTLEHRENLGLPDGRVEVTVETREALARVIREQRPTLLFAHHVEDLHPDHAAAGRLAREAWYLSGLRRLAGAEGDEPLAPGRPERLLHFMGHVPFEPTLVVDIDAFWESKQELIRCYASQLEPAHPGDRGEHLLFGADILARAETKARFFGERIGCRYGEPFLHHGPLAATELTLLGDC